MTDLARVLRDLGGHVVVAPEVCLHLAQDAIRERKDGTVTIGDAVAERLIRIEHYGKRGLAEMVGFGQSSA